MRYSRRMEDRIRGIVAGKLAELGAGDVSFVVEWPTETAHGDFAVNAALAASKALGKNPKEIAEALAEAMRSGLGEDAASVEVAGPGFVNITLSGSAISKLLAQPAARASTGARVMIEYGNPNPFK